VKARATGSRTRDRQQTRATEAEHERKQGLRAGQRGETINNRARKQDSGRETEREGQVRQQVIGERKEKRKEIKERLQHRGSPRKKEGWQKEKDEGEQRIALPLPADGSVDDSNTSAHAQYLTYSTAMRTPGGAPPRVRSRGAAAQLFGHREGCRKTDETGTKLPSLPRSGSCGGSKANAAPTCPTAMRLPAANTVKTTPPGMPWPAQHGQPAAGMPRGTNAPDRELRAPGLQLPARSEGHLPRCLSLRGHRVPPAGAPGSPSSPQCSPAVGDRALRLLPGHLGHRCRSRARRSSREWSVVLSAPGAMGCRRLFWSTERQRRAMAKTKRKKADGGEHRNIPIKLWGRGES